MEKGKSIVKKIALKQKKSKSATRIINTFGRKKNKVAIVGYAPSSRLLAPYNDQDFEIWGVNELYRIAPRVDVLFELHNRKWFRSKARAPKHMDWLKNAKIPIITLDQYKDIPTSVRYPIEAIKDFLNPYDGYFTNSISYMLALAIMFDYDEIHVYGIDMATDEEYQYQRPSVEFYLGIAAGIYKATGRCFVYIPPECDLIKCLYQYGYESDNMTAAKKKMKARKDELTHRINTCNQLIENKRAEVFNLMGARDELNYEGRCLIFHSENNEVMKHGDDKS